MCFLFYNGFPLSFYVLNTDDPVTPHPSKAGKNTLSLKLKLPKGDGVTTERLITFNLFVFADNARRSREEEEESFQGNNNSHDISVVFHTWKKMIVQSTFSIIWILGSSLQSVRWKHEQPPLLLIEYTWKEKKTKKSTLEFPALHLISLTAQILVAGQ